MLTPLELEVLWGLIRGYSAAHNATQLGITVREEQAIQMSLMNKLKANHTADLVRIGLEAGIE